MRIHSGDKAKLNSLLEDLKHIVENGQIASSFTKKFLDEIIDDLEVAKEKDFEEGTYGSSINTIDEVKHTLRITTGC